MASSVTTVAALERQVSDIEAHLAANIKTSGEKYSKELGALRNGAKQIKTAAHEHFKYLASNPTAASTPANTGYLLRIAKILSRASNIVSQVNAIAIRSFQQYTPTAKASTTAPKQRSVASTTLPATNCVLGDTSQFSAKFTAEEIHEGQLYAMQTSGKLLPPAQFPGHDDIKELQNTSCGPNAMEAMLMIMEGSHSYDKTFIKTALQRGSAQYKLKRDEFDAVIAKGARAGASAEDRSAALAAGEAAGQDGITIHPLSGLYHRKGLEIFTRPGSDGIGQIQTVDVHKDNIDSVYKRLLTNLHAAAQSEQSEPAGVLLSLGSRYISVVAKKVEGQVKFFIFDSHTANGEQAYLGHNLSAKDAKQALLNRLGTTAEASRPAILQAAVFNFNVTTNTAFKAKVAASRSAYNSAKTNLVATTNKNLRKYAAERARIEKQTQIAIQMARGGVPVSTHRVVPTSPRRAQKASQPNLMSTFRYKKNPNQAKELLNGVLADAIQRATFASSIADHKLVNRLLDGTYTRQDQKHPLFAIINNGRTLVYSDNKSLIHKQIKSVLEYLKTRLKELEAEEAKALKATEVVAHSSAATTAPTTSPPPMEFISDDNATIVAAAQPAITSLEPKVLCTHIIQAKFEEIAERIYTRTTTSDDETKYPKVFAALDAIRTKIFKSSNKENKALERIEAFGVLEMLLEDHLPE